MVSRLMLKLLLPLLVLFNSFFFAVSFTWCHLITKSFSPLCRWNHEHTQYFFLHFSLYLFLSIPLLLCISLICSSLLFTTLSHFFPLLLRLTLCFFYETVQFSKLYFYLDMHFGKLKTLLYRHVHNPSRFMSQSISHLTYCLSFSSSDKKKFMN